MTVIALRVSCFVHLCMCLFVCCPQIDEELGVYWVNSWKGGALVRQKEEAVISRGSLNVDSYFGHSFLVVDENVSGDWCGVGSTLTFVFDSC